MRPAAMLVRLSRLLAPLTLAPACAAPAQHTHAQNGVSMHDALGMSEIAEGAATDGVARHRTATGYRASAAECLDDPSDWGLPVSLPFWRSSGPAAPFSPASVQRACARGAQAKVSLLRERMRLTVRLKDGQAPPNHILSSTGLCKGEALLHQLSGLVLVPFGKGVIRP